MTDDDEIIRQAEAELILADYEKRCPLRNIVNAVGEVVGQVRVSDQIDERMGMKKPRRSGA